MSAGMLMTFLGCAFVAISSAIRIIEPNITVLEKEINETKQEIYEVHREINNTEELIKEDKIYYNKIIDNLTSTETGTKKELKKLKEKLRIVYNQIIHLHPVEDQLTHKLETLQKQIFKHRFGFQLVDEELDLLQLRKNQGRDLKCFEIKNITVASRLREAWDNDTIKILEFELEVLRGELSELRSNKDLLLEQRNNSNKQSDIQIENLKQVIKELEVNTADGEAIIHQFRSEVKELEKEIGKLLDEVHSATITLNGLKAEVPEKRKRLLGFNKASSCYREVKYDILSSTSVNQVKDK